MARHFYIKSGGTAYSDNSVTALANASTAPSGSWPTDTDAYYDSLADVFLAELNTAGFTCQNDDYFLFSDAHSKTVSSASSDTLNDNGSVLAATYVTFMSVSNSDVAQYSPGASEIWTSVIEPIFEGNIDWLGVNFSHADDGLRYAQIGGHFRIADATFTPTGPGDYGFYASGPVGSVITITNATFDLTASADVRAANCVSAILEMNGGSILATTSQTGTCFYSSNNGEPFRAVFLGVDIQWASSSQDFVYNASTYENSYVYLYNCKIPATNFTPMTPYGPTHRVEMYGCGASGDIRHKLYIHDYYGFAEDNETVYVSAGEDYYGLTVDFSYAITTSAYCSHLNAFVIELPTRAIDLSSTSSNEIHFDIITANTLTDADIGIFVEYDDGTVSTQVNRAFSFPPVSGSEIMDPTATGTELTKTGGLSSTDWTGEGTISSPNYYRISVDTSGDAGAACVPRIRIEVYKPSLTDPIFIHPQLSVS